MKKKVKQENMHIKVGDIIELKTQSRLDPACKYKIIDIDTDIILYQVGGMTGSMKNLGANSYRKINPKDKIDWDKEEEFLLAFFQDLGNSSEPVEILPKSKDTIANSFWGETTVQKIIIS